MKKFRCFKNSILKGVISHAPICANTYKKMMSVYYRYDDVDRCDIKYVFTHNYELCDSLIEDFGEDVKIYILPLTEVENALTMHYRNTHKYKQNIFVIFNKEMGSNLYCEDTNSCLKIIKRKIKDMNIKFSEAFYISNPPFNGNGKQQIYPKFYKFAIQNFKQVLMIFPSKWQGDNTGSGLREMSNVIKKDKQIVCVDNVEDAFPGVDGAKDTCIIYWKRGYNNGLNGKQNVYANGKNCITKDISIRDGKRNELDYLVDLIKTKSKYKFVGMDTITSIRNPYGFYTDFLVVNSNEKYGQESVDMSKIVYLKDVMCIEKDDKKINLYGLVSGNKRCCIELSDDYQMKRQSNNIDKYKIFYSKNWGNYKGEKGKKDPYGGAYSDIIIGKPKDICTESFYESGSFHTLYEAQCHAKYMMTKFARYLLLDKKTGMSCSTDMWSSVPIQDYSEDWWSTDDIDEIDKHLFEKYSVPEYIIKDIENVQQKSIENIFNYGVVDKSSISEMKVNKSKSKYNEEINEPLWD